MDHHTTSTTTNRSISTTQLSDLPTALLVRVLCFLPLPARFRDAAAVCHAWQDAALKATVHLDCAVKFATAPGLQRWLFKHADLGQLLSMRLTGNMGFLNRLDVPWARLLRLQTLDLKHIILKRVARESSTADSTAPLLPALQHLQLEHCSYRAACLARLTDSPQLTALVLSNLLGTGMMSFDDSSDEEEEWEEEEVGRRRMTRVILGALQRQQQTLRVLDLKEPYMTRDASTSTSTLQRVTGMHRLQDLRLRLQDETCGSPLAALPTTLTRLELRHDVNCSVFAAYDSPPTLPPAMHQFSNLVHLHLEFGHLLPAVLCSIPQLRHLQLRSCKLLPERGQGVTAFLRALPVLTQLQHLDLASTRFDAVQRPIYQQLEGSAQPPRYEQFSALTASSQLTALVIPCCGLLQEAVQHMFPAGRQLPQLRRLELRHNAYSVNGPELLRIFSSCPQLELLDIACAMQDVSFDFGLYVPTYIPPVDLSSLLQLPQSCSNLVVGGSAFGVASPAVLAQLTQVSSLSIRESHLLTSDGLRQLTAMRGLKRLVVSECRSISKHFFDGHTWGTLCLTNSDDNQVGCCWWRQQDGCC